MSNPLAKIGASMKNRIRGFLYTPGREWLAGILATGYALVIKRKVARIFSDNGVWIHQYKEGTVTDRFINISSLLADYTRNARDWWFFNYQPKAGDIIFDIGSGKGEDTYSFSKAVGRTGKVISIEAHPQTFQCLLKFCQYNNLANVIPLDVAICEKETEVTIDNPDCDLFSTIVHSAGSGQKIQGASLDALVLKLKVDTIDFIKMNIEGAERMAIQGMTECIKKTRYVCISCHDFLEEKGGPKEMRTKEVVTRFLIENGFKIISRYSDKRPYIRDQVNAINKRLS